MKSWNELSMAEKADVMKLAVEGGVYDLDAIRSGYNEYAKGGKIYIKPENRGKFTALKERTGHSATWFKEHGTPAQRKMATFALNAAKWKHGNGGNLYPGGGFMGMMPINIPAALRGVGRAIKERAYRTITPQNYNIPKATKEFVEGKNRDLTKISPVRNEEWARYLGVPYEGESNFEPSPYRPQKGNTYDTVLRFKDESEILSDQVLSQMIDRQKKTGKNSWFVTGNGGGLGTYTISLGEDEKGKYISYYDDWDINPFKGVSSRVKLPIISDIEDIVPGSNPYTIYGRRYYTDKDIKKSNGGHLYGGKTEPTQKMQIGLRTTNDWKPYTLEQVLDFATKNQQKEQALKNVLERRASDYLTTSNDATAVANGRLQNQHLNERAIKGAKAHRAWEEEHPAATFAGNVLGAAPLAIAAIPAAGAAIESAPAVASSLAPGSAFWMNPAVQQTAASMLGGKAVDLATTTLTPYDSWGKGVSDVVNQTTGWNPNDSWWGSMLADMTNPGYLLPYNTVANNIAKASNHMGDKFNEAKDFVKDVTFQVKPERMDAVNRAFRNEEWSNFLSTRNGDNYYRLVDKSRESYAPKEKYFVSHTTPWEEFSGLGTRETIGTDRLYEFPTETFGALRSSTSRGLPTEFDVTEMGRQHLLYGNTSSGVRGPVRVLSDKNAAILGESPFKIGIVDRPTLESGLYENMPIYEQLGMGNQTVLKGSTLKRAIKDATYNMFERTPFGITKTIHLGK